MGTTQATVGANVFRFIIKMFISSFRPHFPEACKQNIPQNGTNVGGGFGSMYVFPHFHIADYALSSIGFDARHNQLRIPRLADVLQAPTTSQFAKVGYETNTAT